MYLTLSMKSLALEQVHEVKLLGVTLYEELPWLGHADKTVAEMGRLVSVIRGCAYFLVDHTGFVTFDYCLVGWSSATKKKCAQASTCAEQSCMSSSPLFIQGECRGHA